MRGRVMAGTRWRSGSGTLDADRALAVEPVVAIHLAIQSANGYNNRTSWPGPPRTAKKKKEKDIKTKVDINKKLDDYYYYYILRL